MSGPVGRVAAPRGTLGRACTWGTPRSRAAGLLSLVSSLGPFATLKGNFSRAVGQAGADCAQLADPAQAVSLALTTFCGVPQRLLSALLF